MSQIPDLPELPRSGATFKQAMNEPVFTSDQMREYGLACYRAGLEKAAGICEEMVGADDLWNERGVDTVEVNCALPFIVSAIRSEATSSSADPATTDQHLPKHIPSKR